MSIRSSLLTVGILALMLPGLLARPAFAQSFEIGSEASRDYLNFLSEVERRYPADRFLVLGLGRSPWSFVEGLRMQNADWARHLPISDFRYHPSPPNPPHPYDTDRRALTGEEEARLFAYFDRYFPSPELLAGRQVVLLDMTFRRAETVIGIREYLRRYLRARGREAELRSAAFRFVESPSPWPADADIDSIGFRNTGPHGFWVQFKGFTTDYAPHGEVPVGAIPPDGNASITPTPEREVAHRWSLARLRRLIRHSGRRVTGRGPPPVSADDFETVMAATARYGSLDSTQRLHFESLVETILTRPQRYRVYAEILRRNPEAASDLLMELLSNSYSAQDLASGREMVGFLVQHGQGYYTEPLLEAIHAESAEGARWIQLLHRLSPRSETLRENLASVIGTGNRSGPSASDPCHPRLRKTVEQILDLTDPSTARRRPRPPPPPPPPPPLRD